MSDRAMGGAMFETASGGGDPVHRAASTTTDGRASTIRFGAAGAPRRRLVCLPYAGGGAATYRLWPQTLPEDVEVLAVQLPGREPPFSQSPPDSIGAIVDSVLPAMRDLAELPFSLFGHSIGALVAFELTIALERAGGPSPDHLFVSSRRSPDQTNDKPPVNDLPDDDFLDAVQHRYNAVPEAVRREPDLMALLLPRLRADIRAFETYEPITDRRIRCPVHVFGGSDDRHPRPDELDGWQRVAERRVRVRLFEGDHFYLNPRRQDVTADIAATWSRTATSERV